MVKQRLEFLDALRGWAAVWVVLFHMVAMGGTGVIAPTWAHQLAHTGGMGVTLFFLVSAFSLCLTMPNHADKPSPFGSFFIHRLLRIVPLFYFWVVLSLMRDYFVFGVSYDFWKILGQSLFTFNFMPGFQAGFVWASWTIGVEMLFYLAFPLLYKVLNSFTKTLIFCVLSMVFYYYFRSGLLGVWGFDDNNFFHFSIVRHLPVFIAGMLVFYAYKTIKGSKFEGPKLGVGFLVMSVLTFGLLLQVFRQYYYWQAVVFGSLFLGLAFYPWSALVNRLSVFFGKTSYSLYLAHPFIIFLLTPSYHKIMAFDVLLSVRYVLCVGLTFTVLIPTSYLTYILIEKPGINLGRLLNQKLQSRNQVSVPAYAEQTIRSR